MYKQVYLPYEYGWLKLGGVGGPGGGGGGFKWFGPPNDYFYQFIGWFLLATSISISIFATACR